MEFHEMLQSLPGLKGRKMTRALESFSWNITILKVRPTRFRSFFAGAVPDYPAPLN